MVEDDPGISITADDLAVSCRYDCLRSSGSGYAHGSHHRADAVRVVDHTDRPAVVDRVCCRIGLTWSCERCGLLRGTTLKLSVDDLRSVVTDGTPTVVTRHVTDEFDADVLVTVRRRTDDDTDTGGDDGPETDGGTAVAVSFPNTGLESSITESTSVSTVT